jgi:hypothetical protein
MGTGVGTPALREPPVSVHHDRGAWVVRWRHDGRHHSRRFKTEREALAFGEGLVGGAGKPRSSTPNVYPYETRAGIRRRYSYRDSRGRPSSERAAARDRERMIARVRDRGPLRQPTHVRRVLPRLASAAETVRGRGDVDRL